MVGHFFYVTVTVKMFIWLHHLLVAQSAQEGSCPIHAGKSHVRGGGGGGGGWWWLVGWLVGWLVVSLFRVLKKKEAVLLMLGKSSEMFLQLLVVLFLFPRYRMKEAVQFMLGKVMRGCSCAVYCFTQCWKGDRVV